MISAASLYVKQAAFHLSAGPGAGAGRLAGAGAEILGPRLAGSTASFNWNTIALGWAFAVVAAGVISGADNNPAVTLAKLMLGVYSLPHAIVTMVAELAGAFVGAIIVWLAFLPHWEVTEDKGAKLGIFCTGPAIQ